MLKREEGRRGRERRIEGVFSTFQSEVGGSGREGEKAFAKQHEVRVECQDERGVKLVGVGWLD